MRTYGVKQVFQFVEGIWLHRKSRQIRGFFREITWFTSYVRKLFLVTILYQYQNIVYGTVVLHIEQFNLCWNVCDNQVSKRMGENGNAFVRTVLCIALLLDGN